MDIWFVVKPDGSLNEGAATADSTSDSSSGDYSY